MNRLHACFHSATIFIILSALFACSSDDHTGTLRCENGEVWNERSGRCERPSNPGYDAGNSKKDSPPGPETEWGAGPRDTGGSDTDDADAAERDGTSLDAGPDCHDPDNQQHPACLAQTCERLLPGQAPNDELGCLEEDPDCVDGQLDCSFFAHSQAQLYRVDPFRKTATPLGPAPQLLDIDTHPDGTLYGVTFDELLRYDPADQAWTPLGALGLVELPSGLAIDTGGLAILSAEDTIYQVELELGAATPLYHIDNDFRATRACTITRDNALLMSAGAGGLSTSDTLVSVDPQGVASAADEALDFLAVSGLSAAWNRLYGLTKAGELIEINPALGSASLIHHFSDISWRGAASTPDR